MTDLERIKKDVVEMDSRANVCWYDTKVLTKAVRLILEELTADRKTEPTGYNLLPVEDEPQTERRCDECVHFDMPYRKIDEDGCLIIGVECDGVDEVCDKWQTDCPWK